MAHSNTNNHTRSGADGSGARTEIDIQNPYINMDFRIYNIQENIKQRQTTKMETITKIVDGLKGQPIYIQAAAILFALALGLFIGLLPKVILVDIMGLPFNPPKLKFLGANRAPKILPVRSVRTSARSQSIV
jgi:hypothetical protein